MTNTTRFHRSAPSRSLGALLATLTLILGGTAAAHDEPSALQLAAIEDAAEGRAVVRGHYALAIERLRQRRASGDEAFFVQTNLCVAHARLGQLDAAAAACDRSVELASSLAAAAGPSQIDRARRHEALARSNRGVLAALRGETAAAREAFVAALDLGADLAAPGNNLSVLRAEDD